MSKPLHKRITAEKHLTFGQFLQMTKYVGKAAKVKKSLYNPGQALRTPGR